MSCPQQRRAAPWPAARPITGRANRVSIVQQSSAGLDLTWQVEPDPTERLVVVTGVFDLLHVGHVRFLTAARAAGTALVVGIEDDARVRAWKGASRPVVPAADRAEVLAALSAVDGVFVIHGDPTVNDPDSYIALLTPLEPAVLAFTDGDPFTEGRRHAADVLGAKDVEIPFLPGRSTSALLARAGGT